MSNQWAILPFLVNRAIFSLLNLILEKFFYAQGPSGA